MDGVCYLIFSFSTFASFLCGLVEAKDENQKFNALRIKYVVIKVARCTTVPVKLNEKNKWSSLEKRENLPIIANRSEW